MTITCATCGQDSGASEDLDAEALAVLARDGWACAVPRIGEPFRFFCAACWPAVRAREAHLYREEAP